MVYVHVEAVDEVSHAQDLEKKLSAIEDFDSRLVARVLEQDLARQRLGAGVVVRQEGHLRLGVQRAAEGRRSGVDTTALG